MSRPSIMHLKDPLSGFTHFIGALLAASGTLALLLKAPSPWHRASYAVFGLSMLLLYTTSTLYHWVRLNASATVRLRRLDHIMIFILIAGTYTPFCLIPLRGPWGWGLLLGIWSLAILGGLFKLFWLTAPRWLSSCMYVLMGWTALVGLKPLIQALSPGALAWIFTGGTFYTVGALVYALRKPDPWPELFGFHEIFHVFVLLGSASFFWAVYHYVTAFS